MIIRLTGDIDLVTAPQLGDRLLATIVTSPAQTITMDVGGVDFCDSAAIRMIASLAEAAIREGATFRLCRARAHIAWLFTQLGAGHLLTPQAHHDTGAEPRPRAAHGDRTPAAQCPRSR